VLLRITPWDILRDPASPLVQLLDVRAEGSLHTWFNVSVLTVGSLLHAGVAVMARRGGGVCWPWVLTATSLALLSLDDLLALHEKLEPLGRALGGGSGALHFAWLVPGLVLAAGFLAVTVVAARRLPVGSRRWMTVGVVAFLVAAVGLELLGGSVLDGQGDGALYIVVSHAEEVLETWAAAALLCAAVVAVGFRTGRDGSVLVTYRAEVPGTTVQGPAAQADREEPAVPADPPPARYAARVEEGAPTTAVPACDPLVDRKA
jgi:hypothetical protein